LQNGYKEAKRTRIEKIVNFRCFALDKPEQKGLTVSNWRFFVTSYKNRKKRK